MAITVTDRGTGANNSAGTSLVVTPGSNMASGSTGILTLAMDNASGAGGNLSATSYTDSVGNVWYVRNQGVGSTANANAEGAVLSARLVTAFTTSDSVTINFSTSTTAKACHSVTTSRAGSACTVRDRRTPSSACTSWSAVRSTKKSIARSQRTATSFRQS